MKKVITIALILLSLQSRGQEITKVVREISNLNEHYGWATAVNAEWMIIGSPHSTTIDGVDAGEVHIYQLQSGVWQEFQELRNESGASFENFGYSVAINGSWMAVGVVGSFHWGPFSGAVLLYNFNGSEWVLEREYYPAVEMPNQWFGYSLDMNDDFLVVGSINSNGKNVESGDVFVYQDYKSRQSIPTSLAQSSNLSHDNFGYAVGISSGNEIIVGAPDYDGESESSGQAYIYTYSRERWNKSAILTSEEEGVSDMFGVSVAISDTKALVGSLLGNGTTKNSGTAYYFERENNRWTRIQKLNADNGLLNEYFGATVKIVDDIIAIGAPKATVDGQKHAGKLYSFTSDGNTWTQAKEIFEPVPKSDNHFGSGIALGSGQIIVSALLNDDLNSDAGQVYAGRIDVLTTIDPIGLEPLIAANAYPVPSRSTVNIHYSLPSTTKVGLHIYDSMGKLVSPILDNELQLHGDHTVIWDLNYSNGTRASSGIYIYKLSYGGNVFSSKIIVN
ncbi:MAG: T9SS type A sorting domain-containing protein [Reichenbachiella sp.]|uniref:T9SS type A sorting domain-containing protein n=1 Tax=Reichenbachiella sp. TaxID=2184521 RepID=UPI00326642F9